MVEHELDALELVEFVHVGQVGREVDLEHPESAGLGPQHDRVELVARLQDVATLAVGRGSAVRAPQRVGAGRDCRGQQPDLIAARAVAERRELEPLIGLTGPQREVVDPVAVGVEQLEHLRLTRADIHQEVPAPRESAVRERNHVGGGRQAHQAGRAVDGVNLAGVLVEALAQHVLEAGAYQ